MKNSLKFYIDGEWVEPNTLKKLDVINPADESIAGTIALGNEEDVDKAVRAARKAFTTFSLTSVDDRISMLEKINEVYKDRYSEMVETISKEMGAPTWLCKAAQAAMLTAHLKTTINNDVKERWTKKYNLALEREQKRQDLEYKRQNKYVEVK